MKTIKLNTMRKLILSAAICAVSFTTVAQVGVGTTDPKATLDITGDKGMLLPRIADHTTLVPVDGTLDTNDTGLQVYNTTDNKVYIWNGSVWFSQPTTTESGKFGSGIDNPAWEGQFHGTSGTVGLLLSQDETDASTDYENVALGFMTKAGNPSVGIGNSLNKGWTTTVYGDNFGAGLANPNAALKQNDMDFHFFNLGSNIFVMRMEHTGNIGIATESPKVKMDVNGYIKLGASDTSGDLVPVAGMVRYNSGLQVHDGSTWGSINTGSSIFNNVNGSSLVKLTNLSDGATARPSGKEFVVTDTGRLGIGTANPTATLQVAGSTKTNSFILPFNGGINNLLINSNDGFGNTNFYWNATGGPSSVAETTANAYAMSTVLNTGIEFKYTNVTTAGQSQTFLSLLKLNSNGNVGVGLTNPGAKLEVNGYIKVGSTDVTGNATPAAGMIRYNATSNKFEGYTLDLDGNGTANDAGWVNLH